MSDGTKIEWSEATWNPITGCSVHSPGCTNCYAMKLAGGRLKHHPSRAGLTIDTKAGPVWTGETRFNEEWLFQPLRWQKPRMIFVCAHADLFHESVPDEWIDRIFAVMAMAPWHTFQVLTKRAERMREYMVSLDAAMVRAFSPPFQHPSLDDRHATFFASIAPHTPAAWPLPNIWLGVSAEDQTRWDERIGELRTTPAAVRWVSAEPLLGPIHDHFGLDKIDWIVVGGESGNRARPMEIEWAQHLVNQGYAFNVPIFMKQLGRALHPKIYKDFDSFPASLQVREYPKESAHARA